MIFLETGLNGVWHIKQERFSDGRGFLARTFCEGEFLKQGVAFHIKQTNISFNYRAGTLRGMHFQQAPKQESKLVRCSGGRIFDVAVDLRPESTSYCRWFGLELSAENGDALLVPAGCAHGFLTLEDNSEILYQIDEAHAPELAQGVRWNDQAFKIEWPIKPTNINQRDASWADFIP